MYFNHYPYPLYPPPPVYPAPYIYEAHNRQYPPVDPKIFAKSIKSYRLLMDQGSILLDRLGDEGFDVKVMTAAQQGNNTVVDQLIKSIGLKVPVTTKFTPSGVTFELSTRPDPGSPFSCCTLTVHMKWGT